MLIAAISFRNVLYLWLFCTARIRTVQYNKYVQVANNMLPTQEKVTNDTYIWPIYDLRLSHERREGIKGECSSWHAINKAF
jgi:hypothetical protein